MTTKLIAPAARRPRGVRVSTTCSHCEAAFSYVPSDIREGHTQGDGRGGGVRAYRAVNCPGCRRHVDVA